MSESTDGYAMGQCIVTTWENPAAPLGERLLRIDQADPWIHANDELIEELQRAHMAGEGLFRIVAINGSVTYAQRIHNAQQGYWVCERLTPWPTNASAETNA